MHYLKIFNASPSDIVGLSREEMVNELVLEEGMELNDHEEPADQERYGEYQLPGGENYKEVLLTLPNQSSAMADRMTEIEVQMNFMTDIIIEEEREFTEEEDLKLQRLREEYHDLAGKLQDGETFNSSHYDEPNIVAHVRINERTDSEGNRVLFIEEIQSDWGQSIKKRGLEKKMEARAA